MARIASGDVGHFFVARAVPATFPSWKQRLWHALHTRAADPRTDLAREAAWLHRFERSIPCRRCRAHWRKLVRQHPPEFASRYHYFRWTVRMHNSINDRVGHPRFPFAAARARWGFDSTEERCPPTAPTS